MDISRRVNVLRLLEFESKELFSQFGLPVPISAIVESGADVSSGWSTVSAECDLSQVGAVLKAQIPVGGRGKAGLIRVVDSLEHAESVTRSLLGRTHGPYRVDTLLMEERIQIEKELYVSTTIDNGRRRCVLIVSPLGGVDIEQTAEEEPEAIHKFYFKASGITEEQLKKAIKALGLSGDLADQAEAIIKGLVRVLIESDAQLVEINPLVITKDKRLLAADGKIILDDNAIFRQSLISRMQEFKLTELEKRAAKAGFSYVPLEGEVGILANGAGLTLALLDMLQRRGLHPANFLDVGGGAGSDRVLEALSVLQELAPKAVLINIYGGITRCTDVARGILDAIEKLPPLPPIFVRLSGTEEEEGRKILKEADPPIPVFKTVSEVVTEMAREISI